MLLETGIQDVILIYDVEEYAHIRVNKHDTFYITRDFFNKEKFVIDIALNNLRPKNNTKWFPEESKIFNYYIRNPTFKFYLKSFYKYHHMSWDKNDQQWSIDD